jgi:hypothetical protein
MCLLRYRESLNLDDCLRVVVFQMLVCVCVETSYAYQKTQREETFKPGCTGNHFCVTKWFSD